MAVITFMIASIGRPSIANTLASIEAREDDEILVVGRMGVWDRRVRHVPHEPGGDWGHTERNYATPLAKGQYVAHIDDDDVYVPGVRALMQDVIDGTPGRPALFRMQFPNGITLWRDPKVYCGNVGTPMMLIPNVPGKMGKWGSFVGGDCHFLETMKFDHSEIVWRPEVIALLGHNV